LLLRRGVGFKHRTARARELRRVSPQACHDPVHIRDLRAAEPPDIRRAGHLLFHRSPGILRKRHILNGDAAADRYRKTHENPMRSHAQSFFRIQIGVQVPHGKLKPLTLQNKCGLGRFVLNNKM
jgi:hypothetical protein